VLDLVTGAYVPAIGEVNALKNVKVPSRKFILKHHRLIVPEKAGYEACLRSSINTSEFRFRSQASSKKHIHIRNVPV